NAHSDMHDCPPGLATCSQNEKIAYGDMWLKDEMGALLADAAFQQNGILIVTFDESAFSDTAHGGGHIVTIFAGPLVRTRYKSCTFLQLESLLPFTCDQLGVGSCPGSAATAPGMQEMLK